MFITKGHTNAHDRSLMFFFIIFDPDQVLGVLSAKQQLHPVLVPAVFFLYLKLPLENPLGENVLHAVFSCPESWWLFAGAQGFELLGFGD
jgi:hypothetical protein